MMGTGTGKMLISNVNYSRINDVADELNADAFSIVNALISLALDNYDDIDIENAVFENAGIDPND